MTPLYTMWCRPAAGHERRADDVVRVRRAVMGDVVREMGSVPDDQVLVDDRLVVDEPVELRLGARRGLVVDLVRPVAERPQVALRVRVAERGAVVRAGADLVRVARAAPQAPAALARRAPHRPGLP